MQYSVRISFGTVKCVYLLPYLKIYGALMSIHVAVGLVPVQGFVQEGLHQLQNVQNISFVTDEDPRGRNVLLEPDSYVIARQHSINLLDNVA